MANGKGTPECHYCMYCDVFQNDDETGRTSTTDYIRVCNKHHVVLPVLATENLICLDYSPSKASDGWVRSTEEFFEAFNIAAKPRVLYRYFYNDVCMYELMDIGDAARWPTEK